MPKLPSIPGDEGVGEVVEIGNKVSAVDNGERVILTTRYLGTWRYYGIYDERDLHVISPHIPLPEASMLAVAPCAAYRMIRDFRKLTEGETVMQNAANSAYGQCVIQLCKAWNIKTFNIVANNSSYKSIKKYLLDIGATAVYTLEEAEELTSFNTSLTKPVLALNCLGGRYEDVVLKLLEYNGTIVYYGSAFDVPIAKHVLRPDVYFNRFHLCEWDMRASVLEKDIMMNNITKLMILGKLRAPLYQPIEMKNYIYALKNTNTCEAFSNMNYVFDLTLP